MVREMLVPVVFFVIYSVCNACTTFGVGKKASADGSVFATHSNDGSGTTDPRLVKIPARDHEPGSMRPIYSSPEGYPRYVGYDREAPIYFSENCQAGENHCNDFTPIGYIPEVNHTFSYFEATYGTMNEKQVATSESTCSGVYSALPIGSGGSALLSIDQLSQIAMERASTAREAIQIMGELSEQYGFYGESNSFEGGSESLFVSDPTEVWAFHILADPTGTSSIWGAARVPDDSVAVVANMFSIRVMDLEDTANFLGRSDMWELAEKAGLYIPGQPKDFTATFSDGEYAHKYYSGRRMWGVFRLLSPSANLPAEYGNLKEDAPYPFAVKVDTPVSVQGVMGVMRDWYNDTRYSTGEGSGVAGGAFSTPDRYGGNSEDSSVDGNWERTIAIYRSSDSYVVQSRSWLPDAVGGVIWFGPGAAHGTVYVPVLAGMSRAPDTLSYGWQGVYNTSTAFWANRRVLNYAQVKFSYMIEHIRAVQNSCESASVQLVNQLSDNVSLALTTSGLAAITDSLPLLEHLFMRNAEKATFEMNRLLDVLFFTYPDGYKDYWDESGFHSTSLGYPVWWLEAGNYVDGPPDVKVSAESERGKILGYMSQEKKKLEMEAASYSLAVHAENIPGISLREEQHKTTAVAGAAAMGERVLRECISGCGSIAELALYRRCASDCLL